MTATWQVVLSRPAWSLALLTVDFLIESSDREYVDTYAVTRAARRSLVATPGSDFFQTGSQRRSRISFPLEAPTSGKTYSSNRFDVPFHQPEGFEALRPAKSLPAGIGLAGTFDCSKTSASDRRIPSRLQRPMGISPNLLRKSRLKADKNQDRPDRRGPWGWLLVKSRLYRE